MDNPVNPQPIPGSSSTPEESRVEQSAAETSSVEQPKKESETPISTGSSFVTGITAEVISSDTASDEVSTSANAPLSPAVKQETTVAEPVAPAADKATEPGSVTSQPAPGSVSTPEESRVEQSAAATSVTEVAEQPKKESETPTSTGSSFVTGITAEVISSDTASDAAQKEETAQKESVKEESTAVAAPKEAAAEISAPAAEVSTSTNANAPLSPAVKQETAAAEPVAPAAEKAIEPGSETPQVEQSAAEKTPEPTPGNTPVAPRPQSATQTVAVPEITTVFGDAASFGRAEADGRVFLLFKGEEVPVGQYPDVSSEEALAYFTRRFEEIAGQILLAESRVQAKAPSRDLEKTVTTLDEQLAERNFVGDLATAQERLAKLASDVETLKEEEQARREVRRVEVLTATETLVATAESLAAQNPAQLNWKDASSSMNQLFDQWKAEQQSRLKNIDRSIEDEFWERFRTARGTFEKNRREFFAELDATHAEAKRVKEKLIVQAEKISDSTNWSETGREFKRLMDQWKAAPRAGRKEDDALWARFRAAQDKFFQARDEINAELDREYRANLVVKEELLVEAEKLLPIKDLAATKKSFQSIRDRWEAAGKVPRDDMHRVESRMRKVEQTIRDAEAEHWKRTDPAAKARSNNMLSQLDDTIAGLEAELAEATAQGDTKKTAKLEESLAARRAWRDVIQNSTD